MNEYIERDYMVKALSIFRDRKHGDEKFLLGIQSAKEIAENAPAADVAPVVHGRWVTYHESDFGWDEYGVTCSSCGIRIEKQDFPSPGNYCPNCGAKMDFEE